MTSQLDRYLNVCRQAARRHGIEPLFVRTGPSEDIKDDDNLGICYRSRVSGSGDNRRVLEFTFYLDHEIPSVDEYVPPSRTVRLTDSGFYVVDVDNLVAGGLNITLQISGDEVEDFESHGQPPKEKAQNWLSEMKSKFPNFTPNQLLRYMVEIYALGIDRFAESPCYPDIVPKKAKRD